jgi:NAD(P)-dependent dehydrogenase (short-subunit alcohol dehydrogenase family)
MTQLSEQTTQAAENAAVTPKIFDQRVAVVTGGARGIGWAITQALAAAGAHVAAGYHHDRGAAEKLQEEITQAGGSVSIHEGNVGEPADCQRFVDEVLAAQGRIDFLVNNAGVTVDKTVRKMSIDDWHAVLRINLSGPFYMTKAVLDHMLERGSGRIINISSVIGQTGSIGQANYAASKSGLFGFSQSLALEMARKGITVNCVAPGYIETDMVAAVPKEVLDKIAETIPIGRLGQAEEVARVVKFLLEDGSSYITGAVYTVNGGLEM